ncbi:MAG TPA: hypothetical protein VEJ20_04815, partial [Candidatus Eremiobacteraceae bacterium]|nr:hypothetical protein [Candidatus Eremiobacteraceae bacterium]
MAAHVYRCDPERLLAGANFGNRDLFLNLTPRSDVAGLWCADDDQIYCGRWVTQIWSGGERAASLETYHAPAFQATVLRCGGLTARKLAFVPMRAEHARIVHVIVVLENDAEEELEAGITCDVHYPAFVWPGVYKVPTLAARAKRFEHRENGPLIVSATLGRSSEVRVFGASVEPSTTQLTDRGFTRTYSLAVPPRARSVCAFSLAVSNRGEHDAVSTYLNAAPAEDALAQTERFYDAVQQCGFVRTPSGVINRAFDWAKINTVRVQHRYPAGDAFTNDPSQDIVVMRDVAWFALGSDYLTPDFTRSMLELVAEHGVEPGGKITEFINAS